MNYKTFIMNLISFTFKINEHEKAFTYLIYCCSIVLHKCPTRLDTCRTIKYFSKCMGTEIKA